MFRQLANLITRANKHLLLALLLALVYHGALLLFGTFKGTYDAYVHIFFADHYARAWFDPWEYRWYTGFTMTSYPPGSQQSIALLSMLLPGLGLLNSFVIVQLAAILFCTVGIYRFSRLWVSEEASGYAALLFVFSSSIAETAHVFGQLPTLFSLGFLLNALPFVYRWLKTARWRDLLTAWAMNAGTTAGHHVTTLFGALFFVAPVIALALWEQLFVARPNEPELLPRPLLRSLRSLAARYLRRTWTMIGRAGVYGVGLIVMLLVVVLPYWLWSSSDPITQVSIPHASRDSFLENTAAGLIFFVVPWGLALIGLPYAIYKGLTTRARPLILSVLILFVLGTGGTTPIPRLILGGSYDILTLDRFTFWATILVIPLLGEFVVSLRSGRLAQALRDQFGEIFWRGLQAGLLIAFLVFNVFTVTLTQFRRFQPAALDMQPIVNFMQKDQHDRWRYLTLGFGDQFAWLSAQMTATSVDGNYHSARRLPELTTTPVERLEGAKFRGIPGIGSLQQFLAVPDKYNLKFIFSNDQFYDPLLYFSGWNRVQRLENGVMVWEREDIPPLPEVLPRREIPAWQRLMWGIVPLLAIFTGLTMMVLNKGVRGLWGAGRPRRPPRVYDRIDAALQRLSQPPQGALPAKSGRYLLMFWRAPVPRAASPALIRFIRAALALILLASTAGGGIWLATRQGRSPAGVVEAYYDDLDFRRFADAWARLDPLTRPVFDQYLLNLSVSGGLVASYAKLDSVRVSVSQSEPGRALAAARARYVTALGEYETDQTLVLIQRDGTWRIVPELLDISLPPDQFFRQPAVEFRSQGRRQATTGSTAFADVLDRPELQILSARLVRVEGQYSVVGELINTDTDPGDVTVTALAYGADGELLMQYNAQQAMMRRLLPKEVTSFRVDLNAAGAVLAYDEKTFARKAKTPVASFAVYAKAVVTGRDLRRDVAVLDARIERDADGRWRVRGELYNAGTAEVIVPQALLTFYDAQGRVAWSDYAYVNTSIRPQRRVPFEAVIPQTASIERVRDDGDAFANALRDTVTANSAWLERIPLPAGAGFASMRIQVNSFVEEGR